MTEGARVEVRIDTRAGGTVGFLTIDNRAKLNALDRALMNEFVGAVDALASRADLRTASRTAPIAALLHRVR